MLIFNMVSEPNFVLGIKQTSLASKEEYHVHTIIRSHTCFSDGSWLHGILQPPWLCAVSKSNKLKQSRDLILQICANPCFAWWNQHHRRAPRPLAKETQKLNLQLQPHVPPRADNGSWNSHTRRRRFSTPRLDLSHTRHQEGLVVHRSTWPENLVVIRRGTRLHPPPGFLASPSRAGGLSTRLPHAETLLLTSSDVTGWRHHSTSAVSSRQHHVAWLIVDPDRPDPDYTDMTR